VIAALEKVQSGLGAGALPLLHPPNRRPLRWF
jgi:hypothetical protein